MVFDNHPINMHGIHSFSLPIPPQSLCHLSRLHVIEINVLDVFKKQYPNQVDKHLSSFVNSPKLLKYCVYVNDSSHSKLEGQLFQKDILFPITFSHTQENVNCFIQFHISVPCMNFCFYDFTFISLSSHTRNNVSMKMTPNHAPQNVDEHDTIHQNDNKNEEDDDDDDDVEDVEDEDDEEDVEDEDDDDVEDVEDVEDEEDEDDEEDEEDVEDDGDDGDGEDDKSEQGNDMMNISFKRHISHFSPFSHEDEDEDNDDEDDDDDDDIENQTNEDEDVEDTQSTNIEDLLSSKHTSQQRCSKT